MFNSFGKLLPDIPEILSELFIMSHYATTETLMEQKYKNPDSSKINLNFFVIPLGGLEIYPKFALGTLM